MSWAVALVMKAPSRAEALGVDDTVIRLVGGGETGELIGVRGPVEATGVHDGTAHGRAVTVHVLGGGVRHDIGAPLDGTAIDGRGERVVHDQRHAMGMRGGGETLDVEHGECRIGDGLAEDALGVGAEGRLELLIGRVGGDKGALQAHAAHGVDEQIVAAPVDGRARHHVIARPGDIEDGEEVRGLTGARQHGGGAALELAEFLAATASLVGF